MEEDKGKEELSEELNNDSDDLDDKEESWHEIGNSDEDEDGEAENLGLSSINLGLGNLNLKREKKKRKIFQLIDKINKFQLQIYLINFFFFF